MTNIKLTIQYDGTNYCGWQKQKNGISIQEKIEDAIYLVTGEEVNLIGSGRTDRGVHAQGQVANFITSSKVPPSRFKYALNSKLPEDISIVKSELVADDFHSRYDAKGKIYRYLIYNGEIRNPLYNRYAYHVPIKLDFQSMDKAKNYFLGSHDFKAFMAQGSSVKSTVRTIKGISLDQKGNLICLTIEGDGFLYNMVRIIVGTLVEVGLGKIKGDSIPHIIKSKDRKMAGHTAPAKGLCLEKVYY
ncbi:MAG: tRNA pseudouridine(38-40) synthase TruA [Tissierellia bacterium]|nr:tRNA pseudouridine(38-40) synthase TruA [Tissierellia bacterium]